MSIDGARTAAPIGVRIPELDGLRGLAVFLVLIWHLNTFAPVPGSKAAYLNALLRLTWSGVDLFFVLSGFLIGGILIDNRSKESFWGPFYKRRAVRILPIYFAWLALFFAFSAAMRSSNVDASPIRSLLSGPIPSWSYPLFLQNFFMATQMTYGPEWLGITWSLAIEEQFYLVLPPIVRFLPRSILPWLVVAMVCLAPVARTLHFNAGNEYFGPHVLPYCRADALGLGVLAAITIRHKKAWEWLAARPSLLRGVFAILGLGVGLLVFMPAGFLMASVGYSWLALFYTAALLVAVVSPGGAIGRVLRAAPLTWLGTISYCVYIVHQGVNKLVHFAAFRAEPSIRDASTLIATLAALAITLILARLSWRFLEKPLIQFGHARFHFAGRGA